MSDVPAEVARRIRRPAPEGHSVVEGSLPVVSFGDYRTAEVATLALSPSSLEFLDGQGRYLLGGQRRLASLVSLGRSDPGQLATRTSRRFSVTATPTSTERPLAVGTLSGRGSTGWRA